MKSLNNAFILTVITGTFCYPFTSLSCKNLLVNASNYLAVVPVRLFLTATMDFTNILLKEIYVYSL